MSTAEKINRRFHRLGLLYAFIPVLAGVYAAYEVATHGLQQQHAINWRDIFIDGVLLRLSLTLLIAFVVYCLLRVVGSIVLRLDLLQWLTPRSTSTTASMLNAKYVTTPSWPRWNQLGQLLID
jgi:hypothetical protein